MDWLVVIEAVIIVFISSLLQASTGFGFSILSAPFLITIFPVREGIFINLALTFALSVFMFKSMRTQADKKLLKHLILGSLVGIPVGIAILQLVPIIWIKLLLALAIFTVLTAFSFQVRLARTSVRDFVTGFLSGLFTTSIGVPGPPLLVYTAGTEMEKSIVRSTSLTFYIVVYLLGIVSEMMSGGVKLHFLWMTLLLLPPTMVGMWAGQIVFHRLTQQVFKRVLYVILGITGIYLLISI